MDGALTIKSGAREFPDTLRQLQGMLKDLNDVQARIYEPPRKQRQLQAIG